jgi:hypothetical protein
VEQPSAPLVEATAAPVVPPQAAPQIEEPVEEPSERPATTVSQSLEPDVRTRARLPFSERNAFTALIRNVGSLFSAVIPGLKAGTGSSAKVGAVTGRTGRRVLSGLASTTAWVNTARLIARIALEIGKRMDIGVLAYVLSLPVMAFMVLLILLRIVGVGTFLGFVPAIIIAIITGTVFVFTRIRRTRSGNTRRAASAADTLDQDRA